MTTISSCGPEMPDAPQPTFDLTKYRDILGPDVDAEMDELLRTLHEIMNAFVQNAWDVRIIPAFLPEIFDSPSVESGHAVSFTDEEDSCHVP